MATDDRAGEYAIARVDVRAVCSYGWLVRLQRNGKSYSRFFGDGKYGGTAEALDAAREFRDALLEKLPAVYRTIHAKRVTIRNSSGVVGVCRVIREDSKGARYEFWQATWSPAPGARKTAKFSIRRYGDEEAFKLARAAREKGLQDRDVS